MLQLCIMDPTIVCPLRNDHHPKDRTLFALTFGAEVAYLRENIVGDHTQRDFVPERLGDLEHQCGLA